MTVPATKLVSGLCALGLAAGAVACGETASTGSFKGESHNVAQAVSNFQSDATARERKKLCENDLAVSLTARLKSTGGCQAAVKNALQEIDALSLTIESINVSGTSTRALARVKSTYSGKSRITTLTLVKEGSHWKISGVGGPASL